MKVVIEILVVWVVTALVVGVFVGHAIYRGNRD